MIREKTILVMVFIIFSLVTLETIFIFFPKFNIKNSDTIRISDLVSDTGKKKTKKMHSPSLNSSGWINDIFYDRSNIYDDWFRPRYWHSITFYELWTNCLIREFHKFRVMFIYF